MSAFCVSVLSGLSRNFLVSRFCVLLVHGVLNPVLFICAADTKFIYGCMDGLNGKLFGTKDV